MSPRGQRRAGAYTKTTIDLPTPLWRQVKVRAIDDGTDLRRVIIAALTHYLKRKPTKQED